MINITASSNKTYKFIKSLATKKGRTESGCYGVEGIKSVGEAIASVENLRLVAVNEALAEKCAEIVREAQKRGIDVYAVSERLFAAMCDTKTPEGVMCVIEMRSETEIVREGMYLYCDGVADPGNAGTLIRCADAAGASGVVFSGGSVDIYNPKTVRATMGSLFHLPIYTDRDGDFIDKMKKASYRVISGALTHDAKDYRQVSYPKNTVIVVGNEANGISEDTLAKSDDTVIIPIVGKAESLNVAVAGSILMYEWRRNN